MPTIKKKRSLSVTQTDSPLDFCYTPYKHVSIKPGVLYPLLVKSGQNLRGKKQVNYGHIREDIFALDYNEKEIRKVPFRKTYNRDKLVMITSNPSILTQKLSLTIPIDKCQSLMASNIQSTNERGESIHIERVKNIYGKGSYYKQRHDQNDQVEEKQKDVITKFKSDKTLNRNLMELNRKKMTHADRDNLFQLNHEINNVRNLESWFKDSYRKQAINNKINS